ncbi:MAG: hypothetical protein J0M33_23800 [Anaerolineae bacterium]|nr:hypothetical protein [Anaerolineae bacterium]
MSLDVILTWAASNLGELFAWIAGGTLAGFVVLGLLAGIDQVLRGRKVGE